MEIEDLNKQEVKNKIQYMFKPVPVVRESYQPYQSVPPIHQFHFDRIQEYLDFAIDQESIAIDDDTLYVHDLSRSSETAFNSLILQADGAALKSLEKTNVIMNRYFSTRAAYHSMQFLGKTVNVKRKVPYVYGYIIFAPTNGPSKKSVSWIGLHHLEAIISKDRGTLIKMKDYHELTLDIPKQQIDSMVDRSLPMFSAELDSYHMLKHWFEEKSKFYKDNYVSRSYAAYVKDHPVIEPVDGISRCHIDAAVHLIDTFSEEGQSFCKEIKELLSEFGTLDR